MQGAGCYVTLCLEEIDGRGVKSKIRGLEALSGKGTQRSKGRWPGLAQDLLILTSVFD
jgi:hypothetical protein